VITAKETKQKFKEDPHWWRIALFDFVDDFRYHHDPVAIAEPFSPDDEKLDSVFAGVIETLCDELGIPIPAWLRTIPPCREPYFVSGSENLKAITIVESPVRLRLRKVFVMENFLFRV
jgi:hypothetical protein